MAVPGGLPLVPLVYWRGSGSVRLVCKPGEGQFPDKAAVNLTIEEGTIVDAALGGRRDSPSVEVIGTGDDWCRALIDLSPTCLEYRGDQEGRRLIEILGETLFGVRPRA